MVSQKNDPAFSFAMERSLASISLPRSALETQGKSTKKIHPCKHVFHTELLPPDGKAPRFFLKRNLIGENGKTRLVFRMAENDPKGLWTLRVTDVMTGTTAEKKFTLK